MARNTVPPMTPIGLFAPCLSTGTFDESSSPWVIGPGRAWHRERGSSLVALEILLDKEAGQELVRQLKNETRPGNLGGRRSWQDQPVQSLDVISRLHRPHYPYSTGAASPVVLNKLHCCRVNSNSVALGFQHHPSACRHDTTSGVVNEDRSSIFLRTCRRTRRVLKASFKVALHPS